MGRYIKDVKLDQPIDVVSMIMEDYIYHNRFQRTDFNGEMVFGMQDKHGQNRYLKWSYANGVFHVEAWLKSALGGEMGLNGIGGGAGRQEFRESLEQLIAVLKRQPAQGVSSGHVGADPLHHTDNYDTEHKMQRQGQQMSFGSYGETGTKKAGSGSDATPLILAVAALVFSGFPIVGIILAVAALKKCRRGSETSMLGRILAVLALAAAVGTLLTVLIPLVMVPLFDMF